MTVIIFAKIQIISEYTSIMKEKMQFAFLFLKIFLEKRLHIHVQAVDILCNKCEPYFIWLKSKRNSKLSLGFRGKK